MKKRSEEGAIIAYFSLKSLDTAESLLAIVQELVRARHREGKPKVKKAQPPATDMKPGQTFSTGPARP